MTQGWATPFLVQSFNGLTRSSKPSDGMAILVGIRLKSVSSS